MNCPPQVSSINSATPLEKAGDRFKQAKDGYCRSRLAGDLV
jgi:hypothetical protein